ncbi:hypothetical protein ACFX15_039467 [Malus domestica]
MESLCSPSAVIVSTKLSFKPPKTQRQAPTPNLRFPISPTHYNPFSIPSFSFTSTCCTCFSIKASFAASPFDSWFDTKLKIPEENMKLVINKLTVIALSGAHLQTVITIYFAFLFKNPVSDSFISTFVRNFFVTGLSFYAFEKTLRAAFEGYGELVEVKIIMDKISKRSKGYAFIEYTTEDVVRKRQI